MLSQGWFRATYRPDTGITGAIRAHWRRWERNWGASNAKAAAEGLKKLIALVATQIKDVPADQARKRATATVSAMVGGLLLARIADSTHWADTILAETRNL